MSATDSTNRLPASERYLDAIDRHFARLAAERDEAVAERDAAREALAELHAAGLVLAPHVGFIDAKVSVRWDDAMGAAKEALKASERPQPNKEAP